MNLTDLVALVPGVAPVLKDWLGDGGLPVDSTLAELRSITCACGDAGKACPLNVQPNWWERFKNRIALAIRRQLEVKHRLGLFVSKEGELNMCRMCGCCLRLKVWTPISYIKAHVAPDEIASAPEFCWMKKELSL